MNDDAYEFIKVERDRGILTLTLNRPERLNAVHPAMLDELGRIFGEINRDREVDGVILTGAGRAFCAGGDINSIDDRNASDGDHSWSTPLPGRLPIITGLVDLEPPIIAAVNGDAVGLGATMAFFCDIVVAAETARFGDPHINLGIVPGDGGTVIFQHLAGLPQAKLLMLTGDLFSATDAQRFGMVSQVVPGDQLIPTAQQILGRITRHPRLAVRWMKRALQRRLREELVLGLEAASALNWLSVRMEDHQEAINAYQEKRRPNYTGR